jgi:hypothetical protein
VVINTLLLNLQFNFFGVNRYVANLVSIGVVTAWNFWLNLKLSWRVTVVKEDASRALGDSSADRAARQAEGRTQADPSTP